LTKRRLESKNPSRPYGLRDEKMFLDNLGTHRVGRDASPEVRIAFLEQYIEIVVERDEPWVPAARKYARKLVKKLRNGHKVEGNCHQKP
jgi:hypothetical protein